MLTEKDRELYFKCLLTTAETYEILTTCHRPPFPFKEIKHHKYTVLIPFLPQMNFVFIIPKSVLTFLLYMQYHKVQYCFACFKTFYK